MDPIENEEDRKKTISSINVLLEKADRLYKQLQLNKPALEALLIRVSEMGGEKLEEGGQSGEHFLSHMCSFTHSPHY